MGLKVRAVRKFVSYTQCPVSATDFYLVNKVMTHLDWRTLSCRSAVASGDVQEDTPERGLEVAELLKAEHRKARREGGSIQSWSRSVSRLGSAAGLMVKTLMRASKQKP